MEVITLTAPPTDVTDSARPSMTPARLSVGTRSSVAVGSFDGVHLGHRQVLAGCDTALTFEPHPLSVLAPQRAPCLLSDYRTKLRKLDALGIRRVAVIQFNEEWSRLSARGFVEGVIIGRLEARVVSIGANFRFGAGGTGTVATFGDYPELQTRITPLVTSGPDGEPISSTRIRRLVADGQVESAAALLGGPLILPARVVASNRLAIDDAFAKPAEGEYHGSIGGLPTRIRVGAGGDLAVATLVSPDTTVAVAFLQRTGR